MYVIKTIDKNYNRHKLYNYHLQLEDKLVNNETNIFMIFYDMSLMFYLKYV